MSRWVEIVQGLKGELNLGPWDDIPESHYKTLADRCGAEEVEEIERRLIELEREKEELPDWDGDSEDAIWRASVFFREILRLKEE